MARLGQLLRSATSSLKAPYCPDVGDVIWLQFDPQAGREQAGRRPALVLSPRAYNDKARLCVLCPITNQSKGYPFEVEMPNDGSRPVGGFILADQVKSLSWQERNSEFACAASAEVIAEVKAKVRTLLGM